MEAVMLDEITGFTVKSNVTTLSQPFEVWRESTYVPVVLRFCPPKAYVLPAQMEAVMLDEITGFTVKSNVTTLSQPFEVWRESTYVPVVLRFCPPKA